MRIIRLDTQGARGLRDGAWAFDGAGPGHLTVVTGPPQVGLTTLLEAIALSTARLAAGRIAPHSTEILRVGEPTATIRTRWWLDGRERAYAGVVEETLEADVVFQRAAIGRVRADPGLLGLMSRYDHSASLSKVVLIPARRVADSVASLGGDFESEQRRRHLARDAGKFAGLPGALLQHASGSGDRALFEGVQRLFGQLCSARLVGLAGGGRLAFALGGISRVSLEELSFSERNAFVLAATVVLMGLSRSVVLLDTPELGLAPGVAARWLEVLREATPDAQWIVASRDPDITAGVPPAARITLSHPAPEAP